MLVTLLAFRYNKDLFKKEMISSKISNFKHVQIPCTEAIRIRMIVQQLLLWLAWQIPFRISPLSSFAEVGIFCLTPKHCYS